MIRLCFLAFMLPAFVYALSGKLDGASTAIPYDNFHANGKILADCSGSQLLVCNQTGQEIAVGYTSSSVPPATDTLGIKYYLPHGMCRGRARSFYLTDVYVQVTGSSSASSGVVTGDCD